MKRRRKLGSTLNMRLENHILKENSMEVGGCASQCSNKSNLFSSKMTPILAWIVICGALSTVLLRSAFPIYLNVADERFLEIRKCPACYGVLLCPAFLTGEIVPETWSRFRATQYINSKNVYFASFKEKHVVLKKLGHDSKLEHLDRHILEQSVGLLKDSTTHVSVSAAVRPYTQQNVQLDYVQDLQGNNTKLVHHLRVFDLVSRDASNDNLQASKRFKGSEMLICPSQRKMRYIENEFVKNNFGLYRLTCLYNLMTILLLNSEPLVFQTFRSDQGWPFPKFYGACGRVIVEEYVGPNLAQWLPLASWKERLNVALAMLKIADQFTNGTEGFRLYATDISLYNIAVGSDGLPKIIDGENIVVVDVDKIKKERPANYDVPYASDNAGCEDLPSDPDCVSYSEEDMCNRLYNDHNYFVVCRELFSPLDNFGLINGLPKTVLKNFPNVLNYQTDCFASSTPGVRENAAKQLISIYTEILSLVA